MTEITISVMKMYVSQKKDYVSTFTGFIKIIFSRLPAIEYLLHISLLSFFKPINMRLFILILISIVTGITAFAQHGSYSIGGQVHDIKNEPIPGATLQLLSAKDSAMVQTKISKGNGKFEFNQLNTGTYILSVTAAGQKPYFSTVLTLNDQKNKIVLPLIIMAPGKSSTLKEVVVTSKKPLLETDIDKTIVNVDAMIGAATSNTLEVLEKTPGVTVDQNGEISLNGKTGVLVLIEGRQTYMSSTQLAAYLRSLPGGALEKIELMNNPPAKYDAAGSAVINIKLKRNRVQGYNGSISSSYMQGLYNRSNNSLNMNYLNKKINLFGSIGLYTDKNYNEDRSERTYFKTGEVTGYTNLRNYNVYRFHDLNGRLGLDYTLSKKTTVGFVVSGNNRKRKDETDSRNSSFTPSFDPESNGYGFTQGDGRWKQFNSNLNLQHKINDKGSEISGDVNYIRYSNIGNQLLDNTVVDNTNDSNYTFRYYLPSTINIYSAKADYSLPMKNKVMFSAGIKFSQVNNDNNSVYYEETTGRSVQDFSKSNHFLYRENINALYVNVRKDWKRFGMQVGLRAENTNTKGHLLENAAMQDNIVKNHYTGLFPSLYFSYKLDTLQKNSLTVNFSRRINRPNYQQLNPFTTFIDQYSFNTGNPYLDPSYSNSFEFSFRHKQLLSLSIQYDEQRKAVFGATQSVNNIFITKPENAASRNLLAAMANLNFPIAKWWKANFNMAVGIFRTKGKIYDQDLNHRMNAHRLNALQQFTFPKDWSGEVTFRYTSRIINVQRINGSRWSTSAGLQKRFMKGKATVKLNAEDIFRSLRFEDWTRGLTTAEGYHIYMQDTRRVGLALNISLGKETFARKRRHSDNAADDVKGRVE